MLLSLTEYIQTNISTLLCQIWETSVLIIKFYSTLRDIAGKRIVEFDIPQGATIQQLVADIVECYPMMRRDLLNDHGKIYGHVHIFVDGRDVPFVSDNRSEVISNNSIVDIFHAIGGGNNI
tara:strand:- start:346 stop:708 length:363 start_codon:yes stop_codon:yes gene_type:complete